MTVSRKAVCALRAQIATSTDPDYQRREIARLAYAAWEGAGFPPPRPHLLYGQPIVWHLLHKRTL